MSDDLGTRAAALQTEVAGLRQDVGRLGERTDGLRQDMGKLGDRQSRSEGHIKWVAVAAVVAFLLAGGIALTAWRISDTDHRVDAICPILALVVGGADPSTRAPGPDRDAYIAGMNVMRASYEQFRCQSIAPLVPPRTN